MLAVEHLHYRGCDGDAALLFDLHPVGRGVAAGLPRLDAAGDVNGAREQQQLLGQGRLTRVGVRNDGKVRRRATSAVCGVAVTETLKLLEPLILRNLWTPGEANCQAGSTAAVVSICNDDVTLSATTASNPLTKPSGQFARTEQGVIL